MEKIRALLADAQTWLSAASPREKRLLAFAAGGFLLFVVLIVWASFSSSIRKAQITLVEKRDDFEKISRLAAGYVLQEHDSPVINARVGLMPRARMSVV